MTQTPQRILFISEGQLGDALAITPAIKAVRKKFETSSISILLLMRRKYTEGGAADIHELIQNALIKKSSFKGTGEIFMNNPYIDEVLELDRGAIRKLKGYRRLRTEVLNIKILRAHRFDTVISTFAQDRFVLYSYLSGAKVRIGQKKQGFGFLLTSKPDVNQESAGVLKYFCSLLEPLGVECNDFSTTFVIPEENSLKTQKFFEANGLDNSKLIVGIHPGSSQHDRKWLPSGYAKAINLLKQEIGADVILFYSEYDIPYIEEIKKGVNFPIVEVQTRTLSELAAFFAKCNFCITHSSGPRHLAAAIGTRTLGIFDKRDSIRWGIYDEKIHPIVMTRVPCKACPADKCLAIIPEGETYSSLCMRDINEEEVYSRIREMSNQH